MFSVFVEVEALLTLLKTCITSMKNVSSFILHLRVAAYQMSYQIGLIADDTQTSSFNMLSMSFMTLSKE